MKKNLLIANSLIIFIILSCNNPFLQEKKDNSGKMISITDVYITVTNPLENAEPDYIAIIGEDVNFTASDVYWTPEDTVFQEYSYTAEVTLTANDNYYFASDIEAAINENPETIIIENTGDTITISLEFMPTRLIYQADVHVTGPAKNQVPHTEAFIEPDLNFTAGEVSWSPEHNLFQSNTIYTAAVTLTANDGYLFAPNAEAKINGDDETIIVNTGDTLTLSIEFAPTLNNEITSITIISPPHNLEYTHGEMLDLTGLIINVSYDNDTDENLTPADFHSRNIFVNPSNGTVLHRSVHNGHLLVVSLGEEEMEIGNLIVNRKSISISSVQVPESKIFNGNTAATAGEVTFDGLVNEDSLTLGTDYTATAVFATAAAGTNKDYTYTITMLNTTRANNYILTENTKTGTGGTIEKKSITLTPATTVRTLTPIATDNTISITQSGIVNASNPILVNVDSNSFGVTGTQLSITGTSGTLTISYNGTTAVTQTTAVNIPITVSENGNYVLTNQPVISVIIIDGIVVARAIPISTTAHLTAFNTYANTANGRSRHYKLEQNVTASGNWTAIGNNTNRFTGSFNGQGFAISNLTVNSTSAYQGMFGCIGTDGSVRNLGLDNVNIKGGNYTGGIAGASYGSAIENCYTAGSVQGSNYTGGIAGDGYSIRNSYSVCSVTGNNYTGGIIGLFNHTSNAVLENCFSRGTVYGANYVGGIAGANDLNTIRNCVAVNLNIDGTGSSVGRIVGSSDGILTNNRAWSNINIRINNTPKTITSGLTSFDGLSVNTATVKTQSTWGNANGNTGANFNFSSNWKWSINRLPALFNEGYGWGFFDLEMVSITGGTFLMGSPTTETSRDTNENYRTANSGIVTVSAFRMGKFQVTQGQWIEVMGSNPSYFSSNPASGEVQSERPVENISWYEALIFCNRLSMREGLTPAYSIGGSTNPTNWGTAPTTDTNATWNNVSIVSGSTGYRLPTEAQWEYACRAGTTTAYNTGSNTISDSTGWYGANSGGRTREVGRKPPNNWGLYDMHGNVYEWCWDRFAASYNSAGGSTNPTGATSGTNRVLRGGAYNYDFAYMLRSAYRLNYNPDMKYRDTGLRVVLP